MQANPIVVDGVLYATSPKLRVFALDAETGRELWSFDPSRGRRTGRFRHRGVTVFKDRVFVNHRNELWALDIKISFLGKHSLFVGPFGVWMRSIGGIAVDRASTHGVVGMADHRAANAIVYRRA